MYSRLDQSQKNFYSFLHSFIHSFIHEIPFYQTNTTSKLSEYINKYINKLTKPYIDFFLTYLISVCFVFMKTIFKRYIKYH